MKHIVITGASTGIGAAVAQRLISSGQAVQITLLARRLNLLQELQDRLGKKSVHIFALDVTQRLNVEKIFSEIQQSIAPVDVLINNAGLAACSDLSQESSMEDWEKTVDVNIKGLLYCTQAVLPSMVKRKEGYIINLGSVAGVYAYPRSNVYGGTKAFVEHFGLNLRADLLGTGVRVTCIEPGIVEGTEFSSVRFKGDETKAKKVYEGTKPLCPEDIAEAIFFCITQPPHVNINRMEIMPVSQAFSPLAVFRQ
jgi:3-hydroxy acid dehydrogenase / malonic semialdehyde reductase